MLINIECALALCLENIYVSFTMLFDVGKLPTNEGPEVLKT
jgi:hypothetical protein